MGITVYTAIVGTNGDVLRKPTCEQPDGVRLVCFTDAAVADPGPWEVRKLHTFVRDARRTARWHKIHSHKLFPGTDPVVWIDGSLQLVCPATRLVEDGLAGDNVLAAFKHPERNCIYDEHLACRRLRKDNPLLMQKQMDHYKFLGYPPKNGLAETGCVVRVPDACAAFEGEWWAMLNRFSHRDQLSFDFAAWRLKMTYRHLTGRSGKSPYFVFHPHKKRSKRK